MKIATKFRFNFIVLLAIFITSCVKGDDIPLPPDPGLAGMQTLEGIDSKNNGVRDDVEIAIYNKFPNNKIARQLSYQGAKVEQRIILAGARDDIMTNTDLIYEIWDNDMARFVKCSILYEKQHPKDPLGGETFWGGSSYFDWLVKTVSNTPARRVASQRFDHASDGRAFGDKEFDQPCDFLGN